MKWDHVARSKKDGGKVFVEVRNSGEVTLHEGYLESKDAARRDKGNVSGGDAETDTPTTRPEMTQPLQTYFELHRHAAVRAELLGRPAIALRLMLAHAIVGSGLWQVRPEPKCSRNEGTLESVGSSKAQEKFVAERKAVLEMLCIDRGGDNPFIRGNGDDYALCDIFARLLKLSEVETLKVLAYVMAESLEVGNASVEALGNLLSVSMEECWKPDAAFFDLLRDKQTVNAMLGEIAGKAVADANVSETVKVQKGIIVDTLTGAKSLGNDYVLLSLAQPEFGPRRLYVNLGRAAGAEGDDTFALIWNPQD